MAQIPSDKPLKTCPICGKEVRNLGYHVANMHPKSMEKLDAIDETPTLNATNNPISSQKAGSINEMIREKLDTMLNIKIIEMLSNGADLKDVNAALNPTQQNSSVGIKEIKEYHDMIYNEHEAPINLNVESGDGSGWMNIVNNALPIISKFMDRQTPQEPIKTEEIKENDTELRTTKETAIRPIGFIQKETTVNSGESRSTSEESGTIIDTKQSDSGSSGEVN